MFPFFWDIHHIPPLCSGYFLGHFFGVMKLTGVSLKKGAHFLHPYSSLGMITHGVDVFPATAPVIAGWYLEASSIDNRSIAINKYQGLRPYITWKVDGVRHSHQSWFITAPLQIATFWEIRSPSTFNHSVLLHISFYFAAPARKLVFFYCFCNQPINQFTPRKINMEHNHEGLEDQFPF